MKDRFHKDHKYTVNRYRALANAAARGEEDGSNFEAQVSKALTARGNVVKKPEAAPAPAAAPSGEGRIPEIRAKLAKAPYGSAEWRELRRSSARSTAGSTRETWHKRRREALPLARGRRAEAEAGRHPDRRDPLAQVARPVTGKVRAKFDATGNGREVE